MKQQLWNLQAIPGKIVDNPLPQQIEKIFYDEFFHLIDGKQKAKRLKDKTGLTVMATSDNFKHIFFKDNIFQVERAKRIYLMRSTIKHSSHVFDDKKHKNRFHYLQPYKINNQIESFCVITNLAGKISRIVTAFPIEWSRVYAFLQQK